VRTELVVAGLHFRSDFVVWLGDNILQFHNLRIVPKCFKGNDFCHDATGISILPSWPDNLRNQPGHLRRHPDMAAAMAGREKKLSVSSDAGV
jgi:hypothetical protein